MKRLTRYKNGRKSFDCYGCEKLGGDCDPGDCNKQAVSRLESIENILGDTYDPSRLKELVEADRDGRCVVLPVKVGDTINAFRFTEERGLYVVSDVVTSVTTNRNGYTVRTKKHFYPIKQSDLYVFAPISEYPKAMADFYIGTKEAAEKVLEGA